MSDTQGGKLRSAGWLEFPFQSIVASRSFEEIASRLVWLFLPLEFYILTQIGIGATPAPTIVIALLTISVMIAASCLAAFVQVRQGLPYRTCVRIWTVTLMLQWVATLILLASGYFIVQLYGKGSAEDILYALFKNAPKIGSYPAALDPRTFIIYLCYSLIAAVLIRIAARVFGKSEFEEETPRGPNLLIVVPLTAGIMMLTHGVAHLY